MKEPIRKLRCHYLVTCVYNNVFYPVRSFVRRVKDDLNCRKLSQIGSVAHILGNHCWCQYGEDVVADVS